MSVFAKRIIFALVGLVLISVIGIYEPNAQKMLGMFALGWLLMDVAIMVFPEKR